VARSRSLADLAGGNRSEREEEIVRGNLADRSQASGSGAQASTGGVVGEAATKMALDAVTGSAAAAAPAAGAGAGAAAGATEGAGVLKILGLLCWVAAEYYPRDSLDWTRCRNWVLSHPLLTKVYSKHGEKFAGFLRSHPRAHRLFGPVVEYARRQGAKL
jgi:hypothetical protein